MILLVDVAGNSWYVLGSFLARSLAHVVPILVQCAGYLWKSIDPNPWWHTTLNLSHKCYTV